MMSELIVKFKFKSLLLFLFSISAFAQKREILTLEQYIDQVRRFHPVAKQAGIIIEKADADLLSAKGGFDPVFEMELDNKTLDGVKYYRYNDASLKIPTPFGVEFKAGYEKISGEYLNPELTKGLLNYLGFELPLLKGLLIDKRRASLQQAKVLQRQSAQERFLVLNDLLFDAHQTYWQWAAAYELVTVYKNFYGTARQRNELVKVLFRNGDRAMADTVEAFTQVQQIELLQNEANLKYLNASLELSQFLWTQDQKAYLLPTSLLPDSIAFQQIKSLPVLNELVENVAGNHPQVLFYQFKLQDLEVERKLKFQSLLPTLNLKTNLLSKNYSQFRDFESTYLAENYKFGFNFKMPILLRQGRGEYQKMQLKVQETNLQMVDKTWQLANKIRQYYNEATMLNNQIQTTKAMTDNVLFLLKNENLKFAQGESALFLINSRENKVLEMKQKQIELQQKYQKAAIAIEWANGQLR